MVESIYDVFISYNWEIKEQIKELHSKLESIGLKVWRDDTEIKINDLPLRDQLAKAIKNSKIMICCITKKYCESKNCQRELIFGDEIKTKIIVLMIEKIEIRNLDGVGFVISSLARINCYKYPLTWLEDLFPKIKESIQDILQVSNFNINTPIKNSMPADNHKDPDQWSCTVCTFANTNLFKKCLICNHEYKPKKQYVNIKNKTSQDMSTNKNNIPKVLWTCKSCSYSNNPICTINCEMCYTKMEEANSSTAHETVNHEPLNDFIYDYARVWQCKNCSYMNFSKDVKCEKCSMSHQSNTPNKISTSESKKPRLAFLGEDWLCKMCTYVNKANTSVCILCSYIKDDTQINSPNKNKLIQYFNKQKEISPNVNDNDTTN